MAESTFISTANFTNYIGIIKQFPFNLYDSFNGAIYAVWDKSTLFKDAAMTQPVTEVGDYVYVISDISGNGCHWVANSEATRPTYQEVNGKGFIRFTAAATSETSSQGMTMNRKGLSMFSRASYAVIINAMNLKDINPSWRYAFRANVQNGNTQLISIDTTNGTGAIGLTYKRVHADAIQTNLYTKSLNKDLFTFDADYITGRMKTYRNQSEEQLTDLGSTGSLPTANNNGIYLANFNSTGYATMDFHGGLYVIGSEPLTNKRVELENWLLNKI